MTASMSFSTRPLAKRTPRCSGRNSTISGTLAAHGFSSADWPGLGFSRSETKMGSLATVESCTLTSIPDAELPTTMTFYFLLGNWPEDFFPGATYLALVVIWTTIEFRVGDGSWMSLIKGNQPRNVRDERVVVMTAPYNNGIKLRLCALLRLQVQRLNFPRRRTLGRRLLHAQHLSLIRDIRRQLLSILLEILQHGTMSRKQRRALRKVFVGVVHQRVRNVGLQKVVDGRHELNRRALLGPYRLVWTSAWLGPREGKALFSGEGCVVPYAAGGCSLFKDVNL